MATAAAASAADYSQFNISSEDPLKVTAFLQKANESYHLISPASSVAMIPEGCSIVTSVVLVDGTGDRETYPASKADDHPGENSRRCLGKVALDRISGAAGIVWDPILGCRVDNNSDPLYCQWRAVGTYRAFDGSPITVPKNKAVDLRQGSPQAKMMTEKQLPQARMFVMEMAESKAMNRVVRTLGVRMSYTREELKKPFIVARLMLTGANIKDPALKREIVMMRAASMLGGASMLYGGGAGSSHQMSAGPVTHQIAPSAMAPALPAAEPPPVGTPVDEDDEDDAEPIPTPTPGFPVVAFGNKKGWSIDLISEADLTWYLGVCKKAVDDPSKSKYKTSNQRVVDAILKLQKDRAAAPGPSEPKQRAQPPSNAGDAYEGDLT